MRILENVSLSTYTTFRIGGPARYFVVVKSTNDIVEALKYAQDSSLKIFVLGGGSNILVSDSGFDGLVIKNEIEGIEVLREDEDTITVRVGAGNDWDQFVSSMVDKGYGGIENLSLIPGTVGASPVQNIGAYGTEVKDSIISVETIDIDSMEAKTFSNKGCEFSYRDSFFKRNGGYIITHVVFNLSKKPSVNISYKDLTAFFGDRKSDTPVGIKEVRDAVIEIRKSKLPDVSVYGTAGSFFKNPVIDEKQYKVLKKKYPGLPSFPYGKDQVKVPLAWILDHVCGFKGVKRGNVGIYKNQALVIINTGGNANDVISLAKDMISSVKEHTGIDIEPEVQYIGF
jgi:UDP-N-acetylmuramate dehydrogenase